jgi:hypothetical protein
LLLCRTLLSGVALYGARRNPDRRTSEPCCAQLVRAARLAESDEFTTA